MKQKVMKKTAKIAFSGAVNQSKFMEVYHV